MLAASALAVLAGATLWSADLRLDYHPAAYAVKGAKVVPVSGEPIEVGTVVVRDGVITDVGPVDKVEVPFDAEVIEGKGLTVYPGFIDLLTTQGQDAAAVRSTTGAGRAINYADFALARTPDDNRYGITPEYEVAKAVDMGALAEERRKLGFTDVLIAPSGAIATGQSALVDTSGLPRREAIVKAPVGLHVALRSPGGFGGGSEIGHSHEDEAGAVGAPGHRRAGRVPGRTLTSTQAPDRAGHPARRPRPPRRRSPPRRAAGPVRGPCRSIPGPPDGRGRPPPPGDDGRRRTTTTAWPTTRTSAAPAPRPTRRSTPSTPPGPRTLPVWWEANTRDDIHRALDLAEEFGTDAVIVGGREAGKVADRLKSKDVAVVLRLDFPDEPKVPTEAEYRRSCRSRSATMPSR